MALGCIADRDHIRSTWRDHRRKTMVDDFDHHTAGHLTNISGTDHGGGINDDHRQTFGYKLKDDLFSFMLAVPVNKTLWGYIELKSPINHFVGMDAQSSR